MHPQSSSQERRPSAPMTRRLPAQLLPPFQPDPAFEQLLTRTNAYCYSVDYQTGRFRYVSPGIHRLLGYDRAAWQMGGPQAAFEHVHPDDRSCVTDIYAEMNRELLRHSMEDRAELNFVFTCRVRAQPGHYLHLSHHLTFPNIDRYGKPLADFALVSDITSLRVPQVCQLEVHKGPATDPATRKTLLFARHGAVTFSKREIEILRLVAEGVESHEIARRLFISYHTVCTHRKNLLHKAGVKGPVELVGYGRLVGLV
ncbi:regulatory LuxR family protein [Neolewinella xylanilytica]|uniref:Regulatory LuxR family protein n=1 Tax=Neolewinella xylanilytica TaxID=1514080 RepID=A0A2S6I149_9BACT|nr:LuxR C-terminal-related transcriptional regulator [Neolewinella xylanilytica]PPK84699.1 regulatory LuxR family protein [Neolewinella xylanilytica]